MTPNRDGKCPFEAKGKRVHIILNNGWDSRQSPLDKDGWAADSSFWRLTGHSHDIKFFEVAK